MDKEQIKKAVEPLQGLHYWEWEKVRASVDKYFEHQKNLFMRNVTIASPEAVAEMLKNI